MESCRAQGGPRRKDGWMESSWFLGRGLCGLGLMYFEAAVRFCLWYVLTRRDGVGVGVCGDWERQGCVTGVFGLREILVGTRTLRPWPCFQA